MLLSASVAKSRVLAVKLDRNEQEVIALVVPSNITSEEPIYEGGPFVSFPGKQRPGIAHHSAPAQTQMLRLKACPFRAATTNENGGRQ